MGSCFKPTYRDRHGATRKTACWYARYTDAGGVQRRVKGFTDKAATLQLLARLEREATAARHGVDLPAVDSACRAMPELLEEYESLQLARGLSDGHRRNCSAYLGEIIAACGWATFDQVSADRFTRWMAEKLATKVGPSTVNGYWSAAKAFAKWAARRCGVAHPLADVRKLNEAVDLRRSRRIPTAAEVEQIAAAAASAPPRRCLVSGPDRAWLYRLAAYTGFRASELASLGVESFTLAGGVPVAVTVEAADSKGGRRESVPIPSHLAGPLAAWLAAIPAGRRLWPGEWAANRGQWSWLDRDCERAKVEKFPFHALRAFFITSVIAAGANVAELQSLARHRSAATSLKHYARVNTDQLRRLSDALPPPPEAEGKK